MATTRRKRARASHLGPEKRRPQILDCALRMVVEDGPKRVTMDAVAQQLGVTRPVIYACFGSRQELLAALLEREAGRMMDGVQAAMAQYGEIDEPQAMLEHGFRALLQSVAEIPDSWRLAYAAAPDPAVADMFQHGRALVARQIGHLLGSAFKAAGIRDYRSKLPVLTELVVASGEAAIRLLLEQRTDWDAETLGSYMGRMMYGALRAA